MSNAIQRVKGMYDLLPADTPLWHRVERRMVRVLEDYGYAELRLPILERSELFTGAIGEATDVVTKEMYTFTDRGDIRLSLRPEGTAGCVRAMINSGSLREHAQKIWYMGPMFRRENVQRGRHRQFYQIGAEVFGPQGPDADAELILMLGRLWAVLPVEHLQLQLNSLGTQAARATYREALVRYFADHVDQLDDDSVRRLETNPLRILDSKNPRLAALINAAPVMLDYLDSESAEHFQQLQDILAAAGLPFKINPRLVRGLDYYGRTVFEWVTEELGAQGTVCAGGRYDDLVAMQGGKACPAVGFAMGVDRVVALMDAQKVAAQTLPPHVFMVAVGEQAVAQSFALAEALRAQLPSLRIQCNLGGGSFKAQFKRADRSGAALALVLAEAELAAGQVGLKHLQVEAPQQHLGRDHLADWLGQWLNTHSQGEYQSVE